MPIEIRTGKNVKETGVSLGRRAGEAVENRGFSKPKPSDSVAEVVRFSICIPWRKIAKR